MNQLPLPVLREALVESGLLQGSPGARRGGISSVMHSESSQWRPGQGRDEMRGSPTH